MTNTVFTPRNGVLHAESVSLEAIAEQCGTPCYVYSRAAIESAWRAWHAALGTHPHLVCYAVKANSSLAVLNVLARLGSGFDIVSVGELERVLRAGGDPAKVVFSGVGKMPHEIRRALEVGIHCFNVESETELHLLNQLAGENNTRARISLRVNPDVNANTHPYISTGLRDNKFGVAIQDARRLYQLAATLPQLIIAGVDCHIGSQLTTTTPLLDALDRVLVLVDQLAVDGIVLQHLDLGGGLGVTYRDETPPTPAQYINEVLQVIGQRNITLIFEPGRSIVANAGVLLTRVQLLKQNEQKHFAIIDAAMNDLIRPALYQAWMDITPVHAHTRGTQAQWDIVGPVCETGDFLGKERELNLAPHDLLAVHSAGAYGFVMSSNYNTRGRAAEVMVDGDQYQVIRARETIDDLLRGETVLPG